MQYVRRLTRFEYVAPKTIEDACRLFYEYGAKARIIGGGTDLIPKIKRREIAPEVLIGLEGIPGLQTIHTAGPDGLRFGPLATLNSIENYPTVKEKFEVLYQAVYGMASTQVRTLGTVAGNLCNAAPSADTAPALMVLGAKLKLLSPQSERTVPVEQFFTGPSATVLKRGEILAEIQIPESSPNNAGIYIKHTIRRAMDLAIVGVAVSLTLQDGICRDIRIALGAVAPTPIRAVNAEALLKGKGREESIFKNAGREAARECQPIDDVRSSAAYRREMVEVLTRRALEQAWDRCLGQKNALKG